MKRIIFTLLAIFASVALFAQAPNAFNYQGVARDLSGNPIINQNIGLRISILQGSIAGTEVYKELHLVSTNNTGLFNISIGYGNAVSDSIETINWGNSPFFLKIEMDTEGGSNYQLVGTNQLLSVPYALYAENSGTQKQIDALEDMLIDAGLFTVKDVDENTYKTVKIGDQIWMAENLKTTKYNDGTSIPLITDETEWANHPSGAYCYYGNNVDNVGIYGNLYNWYTVIDDHKLCPSGWHVPSLNEVNTLINYLGGSEIAGGKLKETGTVHWLEPNEGATNESGFTALPSGDRNYFGTFENQNRYAAFWNTQDLESYGGVFILYFNNTKVENLGWGKRTGLPVRCIKD